jgi:energy-coupling factor transporter ATP-binding protein EcfA2
MTKVIGISGVASSGKDTLFRLLSKILKEKYGKETFRLSLGDIVRTEVRGFILQKFGIDVFKCTPEQKEALRPFLVSHAEVRRNINGIDYWVKKAEFNLSRVKNPGTPISTDIRYSPEAIWIKQNSGLIIHVSRLTEENGKLKKILPKNEQERINDPIVFNLSDIKFTWKTLSEDLLIPQVESLADNAYLRLYSTV